MIELHCHTTASDGTYTPEELARYAGRLGLSHLAITDHDSVSGVLEAENVCRQAGIRLIPAVELSTSFKGRPMDILGYGIDVRHPVLLRTLQAMVDKRNARTPRIVERLRQAGVAIDIEDVQRAASGHVIGRPHVARALVNLGIVETVQEAFDLYLARGRQGYVPKEVLTPAEAIEVVRATGGMAVLAHPRYLKLQGEAFERMLEELTDLGLGGIEVYYSQHTPDEVLRYRKAAERRGLLATGGSDFHGDNKPHIRLGMGPEGLPIPDSLAEDLLDAIGTSKDV